MSTLVTGAVQKQPAPYYIVYHPAAFNLMENVGRERSPLELLADLTGCDVAALNDKTYLSYLKFDRTRERADIFGYFGMENYTSYYIANQIARADQRATVYIADGRRRGIQDIVREMGRKPVAVFMTAISSTFPTAVAAAIPLNHARIPVVLGGIHVSTSPDDVSLFLRSHAPHPELVTEVRGAGDLDVIRRILEDIRRDTLAPEYIGTETVEDGVWGNRRVKGLRGMKLVFLKKIPLLGGVLADLCRMNVTTPYLGCPYSCAFCSISALPMERRRFISRSPEDFVAELKAFQKDGPSLKNRFFFFLPDNLLLGGRTLETLLDRIIDSDLKINFAVQISLEIALNDSLLRKLRRAGAAHFFIGLESLDIRNLEFIGKHTVRLIKKSGKSVADYYSQCIRKITDQGISVHGAFITGMPYDYFRSFNDHSGVAIADFCRKNHIGIQPATLCDLPGSRNFVRSQKEVAYLYGTQGSLDYFNALCATDLAEVNRTVSDGLMNSPLVAAYMAYDTVSRVGSYANVMRSAAYMTAKAYRATTKWGRINHLDRWLDAFAAVAYQLGVSAYKDLGDDLVYTNRGSKGIFERLYESERNPKVRHMFRNFIPRFTRPRAAWGKAG